VRCGVKSAKQRAHATPRPLCSGDYAKNICVSLTSAQNGNVDPATVEPPYYELLRHQRVAALQPLIAEALPGNPEITFEIGCGHGHYLNAYAAAHPHRTCVGIDLLVDRVKRSERKRDRAKLTNLYFFRADVADFLSALPPQISFSEVFILFPDPWPKRRHHKNRLIQPEMLDLLASRSASGARLYFRTDHQEYFRASHAVIAEHPRWRIEGESSWPFELETVFQQRAESYASVIASRR
jgi:tRNA (guanine-N7-)-methyltransferase